MARTDWFPVHFALASLLYLLVACVDRNKGERERTGGGARTKKEGGNCGLIVRWIVVVVVRSFVGSRFVPQLRGSFLVLLFRGL